MNKSFNHLKDEKSPYLLQHANNPVEWYPWGEEAFEQAKKEDKPIFLSIGYSTCHWCHVMAHESFEDEEVAKLMNKMFISIKVDREERPDIDKIYMTICQMITKSGGWPLTIIMTPDKKPFFAGTYFPKHSKFGRIGMIDLIHQIKDFWYNKRHEVLDSAEQITFALQSISSESPGDKLNQMTIKRAADILRERFDETNGGFGLAPKFPTPHNLMFLLRYWNRTGNTQVLNMVEKTLQFMRKGGIYDHIGFGFHRYSTDAKWFLPHFEKMLYDNALLAMTYLEAFQVTKNNKYAKTAKEILEYIKRDMKSPEGSFYSAEDADSEGEEGKFYLWSYEELKENLNTEDLDLINEVYNIETYGNYLEEATRKETGSNILYLKKEITELAIRLNLPVQLLDEKLERIRQILFNIREKRIRPHRDEKILTDWNGLMIAAFAKAAQVLDKTSYLEIATEAINFILKKMLKEDGSLLHRYKDGQAEINGFLDDYSFIIWALIELYETTFDLKYLKNALKLNDFLIDHFWDNYIGGFFFTSDFSEKLLTRQKEIYDGAIPSGNSVAMLNLLRLSNLTGNTNYEEKAGILSRVFAENVKDNPSAFTQLMIAIDYALGPTYSLVIAGTTDSEKTHNLLKIIKSQFIPNKTLIHRPTEQEKPEIDTISSFIQYFDALNNEPTAYVCINKTCKPPTKNPGKMIELLSPAWKNQS